MNRRRERAQAAVGERRPPTSSLRTTAYHEAGHALARFDLRLPMREISIVPDEETDGHVAAPPAPESLRPDLASYGDGWRGRARAESEAISAYAGIWAARLVSPRAPWWHAGMDQRRASDWISHYCGSDEEESAYLAFLSVRAKQLVRLEQNRPALDALVSALLERRRVSGRDARRIIRTALGMTTSR